MLGLPILAIVIIAVVSVTLAIGGFYIYRRRQFQYRGFFGIDPKSGSEESRGGIVRQVLARMVWELDTLKGLLSYYNQRAGQAIDTETAGGIHVWVDQTRREILQSSAELSSAVVVADHFGHSDVVKELDLQQHLSTQGY